MDVHIDYFKRISKIQEEMTSKGIDLLVATRGKSITYIGGAFIPWRSVALVSKDGYVGLNTLLMDFERVKDDSWLDNVVGCAPLPDMELWEVTVNQIKKLGFEEATLGIELGHSPRMIAGYLFATELEILQESLPKAKFVNSLEVIDRATYVKDSEEIKLLKQSAAIADAAQERVRESLCVGMSELEIAGIGEMEMRRLGSEFHWPVTGSSEIASGHRTWYNMGGCTPPTEKLLQRGENLLVDMHPTYRRYYSDLSHNYLIGKPTIEQERLADAYLRAADKLVTSMKAGATIGQVWNTVNDELTSSGYAQYTLPAFGHGIGIIGHEWYPAILNNDEFRDVVLEENVVEVAALVMNVPDVGGMRLECPVRVTPSGGEMLTNTPLEWTVLPD